MWLEPQIRVLFRTSGFRLALRSLALSLAGAVLVFGIIHHAAEVTWSDQIDGAVSGALSDILSDINNNKQSLTRNVDETLAEGGGLFYAAFSPDGTWLAGNLRTGRPMTLYWTGSKTLRSGDGFILPRRVMAVRGIIQRLPSGESLVIAADATALLSLNELITRSFLAVFGIIVALGLLNGYLSARAALRRADEFATALRDIMGGDLSRRIELSGMGDEFDRLGISVNAMLQKIQELMGNLRQVTNDISHDLRSPLGRVREHLELSRIRFKGPELEAMFDEALAQIDQALEIFTAMLRIAEVEAGARRANFGDVALSSLLTMLAESYEPSLAAIGCSIKIKIEPDIVLRGDKELLTQMFTNLLDNIVLHAEGASCVTIFAARQGERITVAVADDGCGIPPAQRGRILQRFVRLDAARHRPGHGLGLSLAAAVAGLHGGTIAVEDNDPGLKVIVSLKVEG